MAEKPRTTLVWFRRDLRTSDHRALLAAAQSTSRATVGVFIVAATQWQEHGEAGAKIGFWLANLRCLAAELDKLGIPLIVRSAESFDEAPEVLLSLARQLGADGVYFHREYELNERHRDEAVSAAFEAAGLHATSFDDHVAIAPGRVLTGAGHYYNRFFAISAQVDRNSDGFRPHL